MSTGTSPPSSHGFSRSLSTTYSCPSVVTHPCTVRRLPSYASGSWTTSQRGTADALADGAAGGRSECVVAGGCVQRSDAIASRSRSHGEVRAVTGHTRRAGMQRSPKPRCGSTQHGGGMEALLDLLFVVILWSLTRWPFLLLRDQCKSRGGGRKSSELSSVILSNDWRFRRHRHTRHECGKLCRRMNVVQVEDGHVSLPPPLGRFFQDRPIELIP